MQTGIPYDFGLDNKRYELKGTLTPRVNHTVTVGFTENKTIQKNRPGLTGSIEPRTLVTRSLPNDLFVANWNGVLSPKLFATAQMSQKRLGFRNTGGTSTNILDSPFRTRGLTGIPANQHYAAPFFDSNDPEDRNNRQVAGSLSTLLSSGKGGTHDLKGGFEWFRSTNTGGNSQTSTGYVFYSDYVHNGGVPVNDAQGRLIPTFIPNTSRMYEWLATRGARIDIKTASFYVHDRWAVNRRLTVDAGVRAESVRSEATGDIIGADTDTIVPRLAATFDAKGDGRWILQTTYAHYAGKYSEAQFTSNTDVANPTQIRYAYTGPAGEGMDFGPGFNPANYSRVIDGNFPTANVSFADDLHSPVTREFTASVGSQVSQRAYAKVTYVNRDVKGFIDDFITTDNGTTDILRNGVFFGTFDNVVYRNTDEPTRRYQGLLMQGSYRVRSDLQISGHWTVQLQNEGDFEGEAANQPGNPSLFGDNPEVFTADRNLPDRPLRRLPAPQGPHLGRVEPPDRPLRSARRFGDVEVQLGAHLHAVRRQLSVERAAGGARRGRRLCQLAGRRRPEPVLRGAGLAVVRGLRAGRPGRQLLDPGVAHGPALPEDRTAERLQQPEADRVGHGGQRRSERPGRFARLAAELHQRRALRPGDAQPGLPDLPSRLRRRSHGPDGVRSALLDRSGGRPHGAGRPPASHRARRHDRCAA